MGVAGRWEYKAVLIPAIAALLEAGLAPSPSTHARATSSGAPAWAAEAVGAGVAASVAAVKLGGREGPCRPSAADRTRRRGDRGETAGEPVTVVD